MMRRQLALLLGVLSGFSSSQEGSAFAQSAAAAGTPPVRASRSLSRRATRSDEAAPVRLLVLEGVPEFSARVRGQVSDLGLTLVVEAASPVSTRAEVEALVAARAAGQPVDVVAWLGELPGESLADARSMTVYVWLVGHDRVHARQIGPGATGVRSDDDRSATLEAAALMVRSAVRAVSFEREGREHAASPEAPAASSLLAAPSLLAALPVAEPEVDRGVADDGELERLAIGWSPHAGIDWSHAGLNPSGFWSANAGLDLHWGSLSAGVAGGWGLVEPVAHRGVTFEIERRSLVAELGWAVLHRPSFVLRPKLAAGAAWLTRTTRGLAGLAAEPPSTALSAIASGELVAEYRLAGPFTLGLHGGLRWFAHTTRYVVRAPSGDVALAAGWRVQPNMGIALGALF